MDVTIVPRDDWGLLSPESTDREALEQLATPVPHVIIKYHSKTEPCSDSEQCVKYLRRLEKFQMVDIKHSDVDHNFYIGGDGLVYEGRGWNRVGLKEHEYAGKSVDICYMGDWDENNDPPDEMSRAFRFLVEFGVRNNHISKDYDISELRLGDIPDPKVKSTINLRSIKKRKRKHNNKKK